ncbi:hypothetical protein TNCV_4593551 [Trichonephila clavipes]|uniref:Uncharacterized protein n=1 Tax=Trichonephila clavipes TaxID=2585209 RepID=A0A8X6WEW2_TRICX|nr:hypothetical protein TNCV_4593551 [Trichonephila clavipes]
MGPTPLHSHIKGNSRRSINECRCSPPALPVQQNHCQAPSITGLTAPPCFFSSAIHHSLQMPRDQRRKHFRPTRADSDVTAHPIIQVHPTNQKATYQLASTRQTLLRSFTDFGQSSM